ncbi:hypothetical protein HDV04_005317 [Boothiomyces sp. JEL0838]|nr:hypothetical protein HDV04_005317 [Boothiomyces sp. JEL0838]
MLSEAFKVDLNTLVRGEYWFGTDFIMGCNQQRAPKGAVFVGLIISEGTYGKKYLMLNGRERVELFAGYTEAVTDLETIQVSQDGKLIMYSKGKSSYQTVRNAVLSLFYDYNPEMVFIGLITPDRKFKVNILGHDEVIDLDYFGADCQIIYRDLLCIEQKTYPVRAVVLQIVSDDVAIADFNYSYACGVAGKYVPKEFSFLIPAGVNPLYF